MPKLLQTYILISFLIYITISLTVKSDTDLSQSHILLLFGRYFYGHIYIPTTVRCQIHIVPVK